MTLPAIRAEGGMDRMYEYMNDSATSADVGKDKVYMNDSATSIHYTV